MKINHTATLGVITMEPTTQIIDVTILFYAGFTALFAFIFYLLYWIIFEPILHRRKMKRRRKKTSKLAARLIEEQNLQHQNEMETKVQ